MPYSSITHAYEGVANSDARARRDAIGRDAVNGTTGCGYAGSAIPLFLSLTPTVISLEKSIGNCQSWLAGNRPYAQTGIVMKISVKRIALVSLLIIIGLPLLFVSIIAGTIAYDGWRMSKGEYPLAASSDAKIGQFVLRLDRYAIHPFLAEYKRVLTVIDADGKARSRDLFTDTGGGGLLTVCETETGDLRLIDRFETNIVKTDGSLWASTDGEQGIVGTELVLEGGQPMQPGCRRLLGRFDRDDAGDYGFRSADDI
jgi:hypothetical protein